MDASGVGFDRNRGDSAPPGQHAGVDVIRGQTVSSAQGGDVAAMLDEGIRPSDTFDRGVHIGVLQGFKHGGTEATGHDVILHGHQQCDLASLGQQEFDVDRQTASEDFRQLAGELMSEGIVGVA